mmetsp:Transcript_38043/g.80549  ORF Transcript_38043/g.80549 Transcript_38043/m.80549 type:complete len:366 (-) Transcript_38043:286-1383(-)
MGLVWSKPAVDLLVESSLKNGGPLEAPSKGALEAAFDSYCRDAAEGLSAEELKDFLSDYGASGVQACEAYEETASAPPFKSGRGGCTCGLPWSSTGSPSADGSAPPPVLPSSPSAREALLDENDKYTSARKTFVKLQKEAGTFESQCRMLLSQAPGGVITKEKFVGNFDSMIRPFKDYEGACMADLKSTRSASGAGSAAGGGGGEQTTSPEKGTLVATLEESPSGKASPASGGSPTNETPRRFPSAGMVSGASISMASPTSTMTPTGTSVAYEEEVYQIPSCKSFSKSFTGRFTYIGLYNGKGKYRNEIGAIIYFDRFWKLSPKDDVTTYSYGSRSSSRRVPVGVWEAPPFNGTKPGPTVERVSA